MGRVGSWGPGARLPGSPTGLNSPQPRRVNEMSPYGTLPSLHPQGVCTKLPSSGLRQVSPTPQGPECGRGSGELVTEPRRPGWATVGMTALTECSGRNDGSAFSAQAAWSRWPGCL